MKEEGETEELARRRLWPKSQRAICIRHHLTRVLITEVILVNFSGNQLRINLIEIILISASGV